MVSLICFDLETGGLREDAAIIQIGAVALRDGQEWGMFQRKLQFDASQAEPEALALNHYDAEVWRTEAMPEEKALKDFAEFCRAFAWVEKVSKAGRPYKVALLCGHNAVQFDFPRLAARYKQHGIFWPVDFTCILDTLELAKWRFYADRSNGHSNSLEALCRRFEIPLPDAHDALADARAVSLLVMALENTGAYQPEGR